MEEEAEPPRGCRIAFAPGADLDSVEALLREWEIGPVAKV
jgi:hypothetical protein